MNDVTLSGRLTKDVDIRYSNNGSTVAAFTMACDRRVKRGNEYVNEADFIRCVAFGKTAEFVEKYFCKGSFIIVKGSIKTGSYDDKDGKKVYTTDVWVDPVNGIEFGGGKTEQGQKPQVKTPDNGFMDIPDNVADEGMPFN